MLKKIKAIILAVLMATIFPVLRIMGKGTAADGQKANPEEKQPQSQAKTSEQQGRQAGTQESQASNSQAGTPVPQDPVLLERIKELEGELAGRASRIAELEKLAAESTRQSAHLEDSLKQTVAGYRNLIILSNPEVLPELISGETLESLNDSLSKARELTGKVKDNLETQTRLTRVPAGAPVRSPEDLSGLSAREKISRGLTR
jgi:uncharacterized coiled-coil protein SlyX